MYTIIIALFAVLIAGFILIIKLDAEIGLFLSNRIDYICATCGKKETDFEVDI